MRPEIRAAVASTVGVIVYPFAVMLFLAPFSIFRGGPHITPALNALMVPLGLPNLIMDSHYPSGPTHGRPFLFMLVWFIAFNATLYYIPVRLMFEWREGSPRLR